MTSFETKLTLGKKLSVGSVGQVRFWDVLLGWVLLLVFFTYIDLSQLTSHSLLAMTIS